MKEISESQPCLRESEVLARQMWPEEQLVSVVGTPRLPLPFTRERSNERSQEKDNQRVSHLSITLKSHQNSWAALAHLFPGAAHIWGNIQVDV